MDRKINVLIPNATGPTNVGDEAILYSLLGVLRESDANIQITVLTSDPLLCKTEQDLKFDASLYEWSMARSLNFSEKLSRSIQVFTGFFLLKFKMGFLIRNKELQGIINYYKKADLIIYVGGGSLRTIKGIKNSFILLIILMVYTFANLYKTKKIITPLSFGPFYSDWQYKLTAKIIEKSNFFYIRVRDLKNTQIKIFLYPQILDYIWKIKKSGKVKMILFLDLLSAIGLIKRIKTVLKSLMQGLYII
jgi:polysaccharide pyruvyl transferase WcaK-like protein